MGPAYNRSRLSLLPAYPLPAAVCLHPSHAPSAVENLVLCPDQYRLVTCHHSRSFRPSTPGVLGSGASYVVSLHLGLYDPMRQSHGHAATSWHCPYTQRLRCAGAPRRPTGPSLLSLLLLPYVPSTLSRQVRCPLSRCTLDSDSRLPRPLNESSPTTPVSASNIRRDLQFRDCIDRFMLRPACLPSTPDWLQQDEVICSSPCLLSTLSPPLLTLLVTGPRWGSG